MGFRKEYCLESSLFGASVWLLVRERQRNVWGIKLSYRGGLCNDNKGHNFLKTSFDTHFIIKCEQQ